MSAQIEISTESKNQHLTDFLKGKSVEELLAIISMASAEAKKAVKSIAKQAPTEKKAKKGSMPTGSTPPQLYKNNMWVNYVLKHANENGWPMFIVQGKKETTEIEASVHKDGAYVFEKDNKPFNRKQAMSLSKLYWAPKENTGIRQDLYQEFEAQYVPPQPADLVSEPKEPAAPKSPKAPKVVKTEEEKEAEKVAKKAQKKADNAAKKAEEAAKKAAEAAEAAATPVAASQPAAEKPKKAAKKAAEKPVEEKDDFVCEDDGALYPWDWKGKKFLRNFANQVWERIENDDSYEMGQWAGVYDPKTKKIDTSAEEPNFDEE